MKKIYGLLALLLCAVLLAGCQTAATSSSAASSSASVAQSTPTTDGKTIEPMPATLDVANLTDCTFAASFTAADVAQGTDGTQSITMTVYDCDKFDLVDISQLAPGDTIVIEGESVVVTEVESGDNSVTINGGVEQDGWELTTQEDGVYVPTVWDAGPVYHALGEVTLPLDASFVCIDRTDLEKPEVQYTADEFLANTEGTDTEFAASATTVCVEGGNIVELTLNYMP